MLALLLMGCPYTPASAIRDLDGDGVEAMRFGGRDCDDQNHEVGDCDADRDGYRTVSSGGVDCDDLDATVHPDAPEVCDGFDNDCDRLVDDSDPDRRGSTEAFVDNDGDGFGGGEPTLVCELGATEVEVGGDCDDTLPTINPGVPEVCDDLDRNCDGDPRQGAFREWFADEDQDGFGNPSSPVAVGCDAPAGAAPNGADCDDTDPLKRPALLSAPNDPTEACDGFDNDCNGLTDVDDPGLDPALVVVSFVDADGDGFGAEGSAEVRSCSLPPENSLVATDCDDTDAQVAPDGVETCARVGDDDCNGLADSDDPDNDGPLWYLDTDGDGVGIESDSAPLCEATGRPNFAPGFGDCNPNDPDVTDQVLWFPDVDGDGFGNGLVEPVPSCFPVAGRVMTPGDCDDDVAQVGPGALELCDGVDNDCNGQIDEIGNLQGFPDLDNDGFGETGSHFGTYCTGVSNNASDCDDTNPAVNPNGTELCDGIDNDCDGDVDADDANATLVAFYPDVDVDGFGNGDLLPFLGCFAPPGFIEDAEDCDDTNPAEYFDTYTLDTSRPQAATNVHTLQQAIDHPAWCGGHLELVLHEDLEIGDRSFGPSDEIRSLVIRSADPTSPQTLGSGTLTVSEGALELHDLDWEPAGPGAAVRFSAPEVVLLDNVFVGDRTLTAPLVEDFGGETTHRVVLQVQDSVFTRLDSASPLVELEHWGSVRVENSRFEHLSVPALFDVLQPEPAAANRVELQSVSVLDSTVGPIVRTRGGLDVSIERSLFSNLQMTDAAICVEVDDCSFVADPAAPDLLDPELTYDDGTGSHTPLVRLERNTFTGVRNPEQAWLLMQSAQTRTESLGNVFGSDAESPSMAAFVRSPDPQIAAPVWFSLRDQYVDVGGGFSAPGTEHRFREPRMFDLDWPVLGGCSGVTHLVDGLLLNVQIGQMRGASSSQFSRNAVHGMSAWPDLSNHSCVDETPIEPEGNGWLSVGDAGVCEGCTPLDPETLDFVSFGTELHRSRWVLAPRIGTPIPGFAPRAGALFPPLDLDSSGPLWTLDPNQDGMANAWVVMQASQPSCRDVVTQLPDANADPDGDGSNNQQEYADGTWPCIADTDGDGVLDGVDVEPLDALSN